MKLPLVLIIFGLFLIGGAKIAEVFNGEQSEAAVCEEYKGEQE